jgi:SM-20-related protein
MQGAICSARFFNGGSDGSLFSRIAKDIESKGYSIQSGAMPEKLIASLWHHQSYMAHSQFYSAGVGRSNDLLLDERIRRDEICWITGESLAGRQWLKWAAELQQYLNRHLFLGLFSFESHFAQYAPGAFYRRHRDAFRGQANRVLSVVVYLNKDWTDADDGEIVLYANDGDELGIKVQPSWGTVVVFLSEEFPHEVLPAKRDRYSIAGWYRLNTSTFERADPVR